MSTPTSAIAATASGFSGCGSAPAEADASESERSARAHPSAIWLRQELPVHRKSRRRRSAATALSVDAARLPVRAARVQRVRERAQRLRDLPVAHLVADRASVALPLEHAGP